MQIGLRALFVYNSVFYSNPKFNQTAKFAVIFVAVSIILATFVVRYILQGGGKNRGGKNRKQSVGGIFIP